MGFLIVISRLFLNKTPFNMLCHRRMKSFLRHALKIFDKSIDAWKSSDDSLPAAGSKKYGKHYTFVRENSWGNGAVDDWLEKQMPSVSPQSLRLWDTSCEVEDVTCRRDGCVRLVIAPLDDLAHDVERIDAPSKSFAIGYYIEILKEEEVKRISEARSLEDALTEKRTEEYGDEDDDNNCDEAD